MSYPKDLDEYTTAELEEEIAARVALHASGLCSYCGRTHKAKPPCMFPARHSGKEV